MARVTVGSTCSAVLCSGPRCAVRCVAVHEDTQRRDDEQHAQLSQQCDAIHSSRIVLVRATAARSTGAARRRSLLLQCCLCVCLLVAPSVVCSLAMLIRAPLVRMSVCIWSNVQPTRVV